MRACIDGAFGPCVGAGEPTAETCDGRDEDCDGEIDEPPILPRAGDLALGRDETIALPGGAALARRVEAADGRILGVVLAALEIPDTEIHPLSSAMFEADPRSVVALAHPFSDQALLVAAAEASRPLPWQTIVSILMVVAALIPLGLGVYLTIQALRRERQIVASRSEFLSTTAHQLKTPVANLRLFVETLASGRAEGEDDRRRMEEILLHESEKLGDQLERVLSLARLDAAVEGGEGRREPLDLSAVLDELAARWQRVAVLKGLRLVVDAEPDLPVLRGDPRGLSDAIDNVVDNALRHTRDGGSVRVIAQRRGSAVELRVMDEGLGIDEADWRRVFDRFYRGVGGQRSGEGSGLGLAIARAGAAACGGTVTLEVSSEAGSTFCLRFPMKGP